MSEFVKSVLSRYPSRVQAARKWLGQPLTLAEKILVAHLDALDGRPPQRKVDTVALRPDRVAMQDATAQMALLQFMHAGRNKVAVPSTVHCDHLIRAHRGADADLERARTENDEVYAFLKSAAARYGIGFWGPGSGIIHQVVLENYAFPGAMMIGTDSHTPNAGGLGMIAIGIGGADAVDVMAGEPFGLKWPGVIGVKLTGALQGWTSPKDVILKLMEELTVKGGTGHIVEFFGPGVQSISCTGKATICNMGAEHGATTSVFPFDDRMAGYLEATGRSDVAKLARQYAEHLKADPDVEKDPSRYYDRVIELDLSTLEPYVVGPHSPDAARPLAKMRQAAAEQGYPTKLTAALIGSCTNSSYEDISRAAHVVEQARAAGLKLKTQLLVTPGSDQIYNTIKRDGQMATLAEAGAEVLANACGPCIGQWQREDVPKGERNAIISSYNRNFRGRNDGNPETLSFIASPEVVTALAFAGDLGFNPATDTLQTPDGRSLVLQPPKGDDLPRRGFEAGLQGFVEPPADGSSVSVKIDPASKRLQVLERFAPWDGRDFDGLVVLLKAKGKCTTDHISAAGPWLRFRGHLENISDNMFIGAVNAFTGDIGKGTDVLTGDAGKSAGKSFPELAKSYKAKGMGWVVVGDENYGEGSSREHAAMSPRFMGGKAVLVRSFARIHEANLKKQGMLPLVFADPADFEKVQERDRIAIRGLARLAPAGEVRVELHHVDGSVDCIAAKHTLTAEQIEWFRAGSALNWIAQRIVQRIA